MNDRIVSRLHDISVDAGMSAWVHACRLGGEPASVDYRGSELVATASLYKLPLSLVWADFAHDGRIDPRAVIDLPAKGRTPGPTGVAMLLDDVRLSSRDALRMMLTISDNACADALLDHIGREPLNQHLRDLGVSETVVRRGSAAATMQVMRETSAATPGEAEALLASPDDDRASSQYDPALSSASTAAEMCRILSMLWQRGSAAHECVRDAMHLQAWRHRIASAFPHDDVLVAGKTGTLVRLRHEAAVVTFPGEHPIAVTVLTRAVRSERHLPRVDAAIGALARVAVTPLRVPV